MADEGIQAYAEPYIETIESAALSWCASHERAGANMVNLAQSSAAAALLTSYDAGQSMRKYHQRPEYKIDSKSAAAMPRLHLQDIAGDTAGVIKNMCYKDVVRNCALYCVCCGQT